MADKYILRITAGPGYDEDTHEEVPVNKPHPLQIQSPAADIELNVRIRNYQGLPRGSPSTSSYFSTKPHAYNKDQYSISLRFTPHKPSSRQSAGSDARCSGIKGTDLQFGNDFDRPIRDKLPPGFSTAMSIVKWWIDPGLDGDAYADKPYLYGPALSSFNVLHVGPGECNETKGGLCFNEGGDEQGSRSRSSIGMPRDSKGRMKWALRDANKAKWVFQYGQTYGLDFFNPYLDFANLALRLPGFQLPIVKYWDGQGLRRSHQLRYVLRNKDTGEVYLVILFTLYLKEDVNEDGTLKEGAAERVAEAAPGTFIGEKAFSQHNEIRTLEGQPLPRYAKAGAGNYPDDID
ncbi:hypothetical protein HRG_002917 [Hirsutella rhossiliensis]|uniref:Domain of unknown function at the cortex 1 domain-containing protein n=1 Tax=Hirsutella rhossiliensis TaxID=111463 RepID=A0A9P8N2S7_9HYPO|nr:uncharacterized protein HRG_02917 [Hirsutella rhossiliensis]KAH0964901.1 hypothetical protein HRG_02917 [Hirsutella rhossiliensis]